MNDPRYRNSNRHAIRRMLVVDKPKTTPAWNELTSSCFCVPGLRKLAHRTGLGVSGWRGDRGGSIPDEWSHHNHHNRRPSARRGGCFDGGGGDDYDDDDSSVLSDVTGSETFSVLTSCSGDDEDPERTAICWSSDRASDRNSGFRQKINLRNGLDVPRYPRERPPVSPLRPDGPPVSIAATCHPTSASGSNASCGSGTFVVTHNASFLSVGSPASSVSDRHANRGRTHTGDDSLGNGSSGSLHRRTLPLGLQACGEGPKPSEGDLPPLPPRIRPPSPVTTTTRRHRRSDTDVSALGVRDFCTEASCGGGSGEEETPDPGGTERNGGGGLGPPASEHTRKRRSPSSSFRDTHGKPPKQPHASCDHLNATDFLWKNPILESARGANPGTTVLSGWIVALFGARAVPPSSNSSSSKSGPGQSPPAPEFSAGDLWYLRIVERASAPAELVLHRSTDGKAFHRCSIEPDWIPRSLESGDRRLGRSVLISTNHPAPGEEEEEELHGGGNRGWIRLIPVALRESWRGVLDRRMEEHAATAEAEAPATDRGGGAAEEPLETRASAAAADPERPPKHPGPLREDDPKSVFVLPSHGRFAPDAQLDTARHLYFAIDSLVKQQQQQQQRQPPPEEG